MKFVAKFLLSAVCFLVPLGMLQAAESGFEGLYYPQDGSAPSSCSRISQELHPGGMIIDDGFIYSEDLVCELTSKQDRNGAYEFIGKCEAEGDIYRQIITIADFKNGIAVTSQGRTTNWSICQ